MMLRPRFPSIFAIAAAGLCCAMQLNAPRTACAADNKVEFPQPSSHGLVQQRIGTTDFEVDYSRPNKGGREIFGKLVPFGTVWRTGANASTKISFSGNVNFAGKMIPAGRYSLFTIPGPGEWTIIINKDPNQFGAYQYKQADDLARVLVKAETLTTPVETFTIYFADVKESTANLVLAWDGTRVPILVSVDTVTRVTKDIQRVAFTPDATPQFYAQAASYYMTHDFELPTALKFVDLAIEGTPNPYAFWGRKANIQNKLGDKAGALASAEKGLAIAKAHAGPDDPDAVGALEKLVNSLK